MIPLTDPRIEEYLRRLAPLDDPAPMAMEQRARELQLPMVDRLVGRLLYLLTRIKQPRLVVEMGSGFGYSTWWFARAISITGKVVMTDHSPTNISYARSIFQETGLADRVEFRVGDAMEICREYREIDILFMNMDPDGHRYREIVEFMVPRMSRNALVIAYNVLWNGSVVTEGECPETEGIQAFNDFMYSRIDFFTTILPLGNGVMVSYLLS